MLNHQSNITNKVYEISKDFALFSAFQLFFYQHHLFVDFLTCWYIKLIWKQVFLRSRLAFKQGCLARKAGFSGDKRPLVFIHLILKHFLLNFYLFGVIGSGEIKMRSLFNPKIEFCQFNFTLHEKTNLFQNHGFFVSPPA